jgi:hypothetical protein
MGRGSARGRVERRDFTLRGYLQEGTNGGAAVLPQFLLSRPLPSNLMAGLRAAVPCGRFSVTWKEEASNATAFWINPNRPRQPISCSGFMAIVSINGHGTLQMHSTSIGLGL